MNFIKNDSKEILIYNNMKLSIFAPSIRPQCWKNFYDMCAVTNIEFEIVFVGDKEPLNKLPDNFKFIRASVKPTQAAEIARLNCTGDFLIYVVDDLEFQPYSFDKLLENYLNTEDKHMYVGGEYAINSRVFHWNDTVDNAYRFNIKNVNSKELLVTPMLSKRLYDIVGGFDINFVGAYHIEDVIMRLHMLGYIPRIVEGVVFTENRGLTNGISLSSTGFFPRDRVYLESLWGVDGLNKERSHPVDFFKDKDLLTVNQGCQ